MRKLILTTCLIVGTPLMGELQPPGTCFTEKDWIKIQEMDRSTADVIILKDGSTISGSFLQLPPLNFSFGKLPFKLENVAAIALNNKMQVITEEGLSYIGELPEENFVVLQYVPSIENPTYTMEKEIDPKTISHVIFKSRTSPHPTSNRQLYNLELANGERVPVSITTPLINFSTGLRDQEIQTKNILDLHVDDGIYGKTLDEKGEEQEFDFAFAKDKTLRIHVENFKDPLLLPWDQIYKIKKMTPVLEETSEIAYHEVKQTEKLTSQLDETLQENTRLSELYSELNQEKKEQEEAIQNLHQQTQELRTSLEEEQNRNTALLDDLQREREALAGKENEIQNLNTTLSEYTDIETTIEELKSELSFEKKHNVTLQEQIEELFVQNDDLTEMKEQLAKKDNELEKLQAAHHTMEGTLQEHKEMTDLTNSYKDLLTNKEEELEALKEYTNSVENRLDEMKNEFAFLQESFTAKDEDMAELQDTYSEVKQEFLTYIEELKNEAAQYKNASEQKDLLFKQMQAQSAQMEEELLSAETAASQRDEAFNELQNELKLLTKEYASFKTTLAQNDEERIEFVKNHESIQQLLADKEREIDSLRKAETRLTSQIQELADTYQVDAKERDGEFNELQNLLADKEREIDSLREAETRLTSQIQELADTYQVAAKERDGEFNELQNLLADKEREIDSLREAETRLSAQNEQEKVELQKRAQSLQELLAERESEIDFLREAYAGEKTDIYEMLREQEDLTAQLEEKTQLTTELQTQTHTLEESLAQLNQKMNEERAGLQGLLAERDREIELLTEAFSEEKTSLAAEFQSQTDTLRSQLSQLGQEYENLKNTLATVEQERTSFEEMKHHLAENNTQLIAAMENLKGSQNQVKEYANLIAEERTWAESLEEELASFQKLLQIKNESFKDVTELYTQLKSDFQKEVEKSSSLQERLDQLHSDFQEIAQKKEELEQQLLTSSL